LIQTYFYWFQERQKSFLVSPLGGVQRTQFVQMYPPLPLLDVRYLVKSLGRLVLGLLGSLGFGDGPFCRTTCKVTLLVLRDKKVRPRASLARQKGPSQKRPKRKGGFEPPPLL